MAASTARRIHSERVRSFAFAAFANRSASAFVNLMGNDLALCFALRQLRPSGFTLLVAISLTLGLAAQRRIDRASMSVELWARLTRDYLERLPIGRVILARGAPMV
jgi:hypothetical protein